MTTLPQDHRPALRPPQFRLSTLMVAIGLVCVATTTLKLVGPIGAFAVILLILSVLGHITSTALGNRLRANGDCPVDEKDRPLGRSSQTRATLPTTTPTRLQQRGVGVFLTAFVVLTVAASAGAGVAWMVHSGTKDPSAQEVILAATAFGVLGGIWGLIGGGFLIVAFGAWREAS